MRPTASSHDGAGRDDGPDAASGLVEVSAPTSGALALTKREAAESLGISQRKLEQYIGSGELPSIKFGRARRVLRSDLAGFAQTLRDQTLRAEHPDQHPGGLPVLGR